MMPKKRILFKLKDYLEACEDEQYLRLYGNNNLLYGSDTANSFLRTLPRKLLNKKVIYYSDDNTVVVINYSIPIL